MSHSHEWSDGDAQPDAEPDDFDDVPTRPSFLSRLADTPEGAQVLARWMETVAEEDEMNRRTARHRHRPVLPPPVRAKQIVVDRQQFHRFAALGRLAIDGATAHAVFATALREANGEPAAIGQLAVIAATGAMVATVRDVVSRHLPPAPEGTPPGTYPESALPDWAADLLHATGQISGAAAAEPAPPAGPVKSDLELVQRAARIGLVLADG